MSVRPREAAETASRFSLRSVFAGAGAGAGGGEAYGYGYGYGWNGPPSPESPPAAGDAPFPFAGFPTSAAASMASMPPRAAGIPAYHTNPPPAMPLMPSVGNPNSNATSSGLRFTLPSMKSAGSTATLNTNAGSARSLQPGFITGGAAQTTQESLRLNGVIADLQAKLDASSERLASAERSVARGNKALATERATYSARITALSADLKNAQAREAAARTELANVPRMEALDMERFKMQAEGAVELQARYDEAVSRGDELERAVAEINDAHEVLKVQHAALEEALVAAQLAADASAAAAEEAIMAKVEAEARAEAPVAEAPVAELVASLPPPATAPPDGAADAASREAVLADLSLEDEQPAAAAAAEAPAEPPLDAITALRAAVEEHLSTIQTLKESEVEADSIIKSNDLKIAALCAERDALVEKSAALEQSIAEANQLSDDSVCEIEKSSLATRLANDAMDALEQAGTAATPEMRADAARKRMLANRLWRALETGAPAAPVVTMATYEDDAGAADRPAVDTHATRTALATGMNLGAGLFGTSAPALEESVGIDLHAVTAAQCWECDVEEEEGDKEEETAGIVRTQEPAAVSQQVRINGLVKAISTDLKWQLSHFAEAWKERVTLDDM